MGVIRLLSGILLVISIIGLSACGDKNSDTYTLDDINSREVLSEEKYPEDSGSELEPEPKKEPPSDPANNSDEVLKTMEIPLKNGEALTLSVIGKKKDDIELYGVREINVYKKENLLQSILIQEAILIDGVDGIDEGYSECFSADESAGLKDVNFDGYMDVEVCGWTPNNSIPYYYWCWNNDTQQFEYSFCLQLSEIDEVNNQLIASYKVENGLYYTDYYHVNDKNKLELVDRKIEDYRLE